MPVNKTHRAIVTITFDRPITRAEALAHARHDLAGEYYLSGNQAVRRMKVEKVERLRPPRSLREAAARGREARVPTDAHAAQPSGISGELAAPTPPAAEAPEQEPVAVKPLEWQPVEDARYSGGVRPGHFAADIYRITAARDGMFSIDDGRFSFLGAYFASIGDAMATAQDDYERRIRSALVSAPPTYADAEAKGFERNEIEKDMCSACGGGAKGCTSEFRCLRCNGTGKEPDADLVKPKGQAIAPGHVCEHGIRWPWACYDCDAATIRSLASPAPKGEGHV